MATRDLTYLIDFNVEGAEDLTTAATNMENLADATNGIDEGTHTVDIEVPENLSSDIDDVGGSLDDMGTKADDAKGKGDLLESTMGKVAAGALIVGQAVEIGGRLAEIAGRLWDAYNTKQDITEETTRAVTDALLAQSGAIGIVAGELEDVIENAETADEILNASIWEGIEAARGAEEVEKLRTALLDVGLTFDDLGPTIVAFEDGAGAAISDVFAGNVDNIDLFNQALAEAPRVMGQLAPALQDLSFEDFAAAVGDAVQSADSLEGAMIALTNAGFGDLATAFEEQIGALEQLDDAQENVDYSTLIEQTLAAAESSSTLRGVLDEVRTDLGPDASEFEVWTSYVERLQEVQGAAEGTDAALDEATAPREGALNIETEQALADAQVLRDELDTATAPRTAPVTAEADIDEAADDLDSLPQSERIAVINTQADLAAAAEALLNETDRPRTAYIIADALVGIAQGELDDLVNEDRTALIDVATGSIDLPSATELRNRIGTVRVPIQAFWNTRIEGHRPI